MGGGSNPDVRCTAHRGRTDTVALTSGTFTYGLNANWSQAVNTNFRIRFNIENLDASTSSSQSYSLQFSINSTTNYSNVTATSNVRNVASTQYTNGDLDSTGTNRLPDVVVTGGPGGSAVGVSNNASSLSMGIAANRSREVEFCLQIVAGVANGDIVRVRPVGSAALTYHTSFIPPELTVTGVAGGAFTPALNAYQFAEDGTESGATLIGSLNTALTRDVTSNSNLQLRVRIQETGGASGATTDDYTLQYSKNGGAFTTITQFSSVVLAHISSALVDGGPTTNRLGAGSGSFVAGEQDDSATLTDHQLTASNFTEHVFAISLTAVDLANGDQLTFRVLLNGSPITSNQTPTINVTKVTPAGMVFQRKGINFQHMLVR